MSSKPTTAVDLAAEREAAELKVHERAVVGILLSDPSIADEVIAAVDPEMFSVLDTRKAFEGLAMLHQAGVGLNDRNMIGAKLLAMGVSPDQCTIAALHKLKNEAFPHNRRHHFAEIRKAWLKRQVIKLGTNVSERTRLTGDPEKEIAWLESQLSLLAMGGNALETRRAEVIADDVLEEIRQSATSPPGVMSGILELDEHMGPVMPGELVIVAARPGQGKTALAMQIAQRVATRGQVVFVSLEMRDRELIRRSLSAMSGVNSKRLREAKVTEMEFDQLRGARMELRGLPLEICAPNRATIQQIVGMAKYRKAIGGSVRMLFVDYIGLIRAGSGERGMDRHLQVGEFTSGLKALGKELGCPVVALAQLNRDAQNKPPTLANLDPSNRTPTLFC
jgi:replicative DNA helicase